MPIYSCFSCQTKIGEPHSLSDTCPTCGLSYDLPLTKPPDSIGSYRILRALDRGYYGCSYLAQYGVLEQTCVLKLIPSRLYETHGKNFLAECKRHAQIAKETDHVVP